jgi:hypothetical protein
LKKEHNHLETSVRELEMVVQINLGLIGFLWNFQTAQRIYAYMKFKYVKHFYFDKNGSNMLDIITNYIVNLHV